MTTVGYGDMTYDVLNFINDLVARLCLLSLNVFFNSFLITYFGVLTFHNTSKPTVACIASYENNFKF